MINLIIGLEQQLINFMKEVLNIVNENDEIIGEETRKNIHKNGLLHREIHVDFITPDKKIIFQHRAKDKDTYPDLLDTTVGGHVEIGDDYERTAIKETEEETGVKITANDLIVVDKIKKRGEDNVTGKINYAFSSRYVYVYRGDIKDLIIESGKSLGFEIWTFEELLNLSEHEKGRFIPSVLNFAITELFNFVNNLEID